VRGVSHLRTDSGDVRDAARGARTRIRLPANVFEEFRSWLAAVPPLRPTDRWLSAWLEVHVLASQVRPSSDRLTPIGGYSEYTLCRFVLAEAGLSGDATPAAQAESMRRWLAHNRPGPALRADMRTTGFGRLLDEQPTHAPDGAAPARRRPPCPPPV